MDKLQKYQQIIKEVLTNYNSMGLTDPNHIERREMRLLFDDEHARYQLLRSSWRGIKRFFHVIFHFEIIDEKIWVQHCATDYDIVEDLENKGVPKEDIVLAFLAPEVWKHSGYAAPAYP